MQNDDDEDHNDDREGYDGGQSGATRLLSLRKMVSARLLRKVLARRRRLRAPNELYSPFVPTGHDGVRLFLTAAKVSTSDVVCDLGCGDGRVCIAAAKLCGARAIGVEMDAKLVQRARSLLRKEADQDDDGNGGNDCKASRLEKLVSIFQCSVDDPKIIALLPQVTVVFMFMLPKVVRFMRFVLLRHLPDNAVVVTYTFKMLADDEDQSLWVPEWVIPVRSDSTRLFCYRITAQTRERMLTLEPPPKHSATGAGMSTMATKSSAGINN